MAAGCHFCHRNLEVSVLFSLSWTVLTPPQIDQKHEGFAPSRHVCVPEQYCLCRDKDRGRKPCKERESVSVSAQQQELSTNVRRVERQSTNHRVFTVCVVQYSEL
jgi:hypothetical protein